MRRTEPLFSLPPLPPALPPSILSTPPPSLPCPLPQPLPARAESEEDGLSTPKAGGARKGPPPIENHSPARARPPLAGLGCALDACLLPLYKGVWFQGFQRRGLEMGARAAPGLCVVRLQVLHQRRPGPRCGEQVECRTALTAQTCDLLGGGGSGKGEGKTEVQTVLPRGTGIS